MNEFSVKTTVVHGIGTIDEIGNLVKTFPVRKVMICTDTFLATTDSCRRIERSLMRKDIAFCVYTKVQPEPIDIDCDSGAEYCQKHEIDLIIALGGGSVMDQAKAMAAIVTNNKPCRDLEDTVIEHPMLPLICVPTTAGTGSEVTFVAVITNTQKAYKMTLMDRNSLSPNYAVCDASVLSTLPRHLISSCGIDALTHAIEAYTSKCAQPITDTLALNAIELIGEHLYCAYCNSDSKNLRHHEQLLHASTLAGIAFINANVGSVHAVAEVTGVKYHIPHGVANAIFLPHVMEHNIAGNEDKFSKIARALGIKETDKIKAAQDSIRHIEILIAKMDIPKLSSFPQVRRSDFEELSHLAFKNVLSADNPKPVTPEDYYHILNKAFS